MLRSDRSKDRGGGVAVVYNNKYSSMVSEVTINFETGDNFEIVAFDLIISKNKQSRFVCVYLPPKHSRDISIIATLINILHSLISKSPIYIFGDFNFSDISWTGSKPTATTSASLMFISFMYQNNLKQLLSSSTHNLGNILDLFITSHSQKINKINIREPLTTTNDHNMIEISLCIQSFKSIVLPKKLNFFAADYSKINSYLLNVDWTEIFKTNNNNDLLFNSFTQVLQNSISQYVPLTRNSNKIKLPIHLKKLLTQKQTLYKQSKIDHSLKFKYKIIDKFYRQEIKNHLKQQEEKIIFSNSSNGLYKFINKKLRNFRHIPPLKDKDGLIFTEPLEKSNYLNSFFSTVFQKDDGITPHLNPLSQNNNNILPMNSFFISLNDVSNAIADLKNTVSKTPDQIPSIFIKNTTSSLLEPLTKLFNFSLIERKVPSIWKEAYIVPIHKKGLQNEVSNYRPISLTSVFC